jgi:hypothetical protein
MSGGAPLDSRILHGSAKPPREGWEEAFRLMQIAADDRLLDGDSLIRADWDEEE